MHRLWVIATPLFTGSSRRVKVLDIIRGGGIINTNSLNIVLTKVQVGLGWKAYGGVLIPEP